MNNKAKTINLFNDFIKSEGFNYYENKRKEDGLSLNIESFVLYDCIDDIELERYLSYLEDNIKHLNIKKCKNKLLNTSRYKESVIVENGILLNDIYLLKEFNIFIKHIYVNIIRIASDKFILEYKISIKDDMSALLKQAFSSINYVINKSFKHFNYLFELFDLNEFDEGISLNTYNISKIEKILSFALQINILSIFKEINSYGMKYVLPSIINYTTNSIELDYSCFINNTFNKSKVKEINKIPKLDYNKTVKFANFKEYKKYDEPLKTFWFITDYGSILFNNDNGHYSYIHEYNEDVDPTKNNIYNNQYFLKKKHIKHGMISKVVNYIPNMYDFYDYFISYPMDFYLHLFYFIEDYDLLQIEKKYRGLDIKINKKDYSKIRTFKSQIEDLTYEGNCENIFKLITIDNTTIEQNKNQKVFKTGKKTEFINRVNELFNDLTFINNEQRNNLNTQFGAYTLIFTFFSFIMGMKNGWFWLGLISSLIIILFIRIILYTIKLFKNFFYRK